MPEGTSDHFDFFLSRRGAVAAVAREVCDVLTSMSYTVFVQDYDIPLGESFIAAMHDAIKASRDLLILFTREYETSAYTRKEFTSFEAQRRGAAHRFCWRDRVKRQKSLLARQRRRQGVLPAGAAVRSPRCW